MSKAIIALCITVVIIVIMAAYIVTQQDKRAYFQKVTGKVTLSVKDDITKEGISGVVMFYSRSGNLLETCFVIDGVGTSSEEYTAQEWLRLKFVFPMYSLFWRTEVLQSYGSHRIRIVEIGLTKEPNYEITAVDSGDNMLTTIHIKELNTPYPAVAIKISNKVKESAWVSSYDPINRIVWEPIFYVKLWDGDYRFINVKSHFLEEEEKGFSSYALYYGYGIGDVLDKLKEDNVIHFLLELNIRDWLPKFGKTTIEYGVILYSSIRFREMYGSWGVDALIFRGFLEVTG